jgi:VanZ family protein
VTAVHDSVSLNRGLAFTTQVVPAIAYTSAIFYGGLVQLRALPEVGFVPTDKLLHTLAFGGLALLLARAAHWIRPASSISKKLLSAGLMSSLLGLLLEVCQAFVPYRSADPWDWVADTVGAVLAGSLAFAVLHYWVARRAPG